MTDFVATLIARPENASDLETAATVCGAAVAVTRSDVLSGNEAIDLYFSSSDFIETHRAALEARVAGTSVDVVVQPVANRRKRLLVADMDSTIIGQECIDELADFVGLKAKVAAITDRAMRGEIEFEPALRERVALLAGLPEETIDKVIAERVTLNPGAKTLVWTMRANGATCILVSGGFTAFAEKVAAMVGFNESHANVLLASGGKLTGKVQEPILGRSAKLATLEDAMIRFDIPPDRTLAVGDGANDLAMIRRAALGVAYHAKPKVAEAAAARIDHADLTALLYAQGYKRHQFVE
ncbi:MAG TPA: phosphoserine phosphatase SerB [Bauldia sp.]|nr:phosphoserine phosphatase SerB [Bauldia sp.]